MKQVYKNNDKYEILTPNGWEDFDGVFKNEDAHRDAMTITFIDNTSITATMDHLFFMNGDPIKVCDLKVGDLLDSGAIYASKEIKSLDGILLQDTYEIYNAMNHVIIVNGVNSHQCDEMSFIRPSVSKEFWTSISPTLSTGGRSIITSTPNNDEDQFALIWKGANKCEDEYGNETDIGINGYKAFKAIWSDHPDRDLAWEAKERAKMTDEQFQREHLCLYSDSLLTVQLPSGDVVTRTIEELYMELL